MEEKIIIKSQHSNIKKFTIVASIVALALGISIFLYTYSNVYNSYSYDYYNFDDMSYGFTDCKHTQSSYYGYGAYQVKLEATVTNEAQLHLVHPDVWSYIECVGYMQGDMVEWALTFIVPAVLIVVILLIYYSKYSKLSLVVTNERVYGTAAYGKGFDIPISNVTSVGTSSLNGIDIGTTSGKIKIKIVKNQKEIRSCLSQLLVENQQATKENLAPNNVAASSADEIKKYKELLDSGIITQEEFEAKKKQLLGL